MRTSSGNNSERSLCRNLFGSSSKKLNTELPYDTAVFILSVHPDPDTYTPPVHASMVHSSNLVSMEQNVVGTHNGIPFHMEKREILTHVLTGKNLEDIILSEMLHCST
jgi:hypothetical protein